MRKRSKVQRKSHMAEAGDLDCRELVELVTDYVEGALAPDERRLFEDHIGVCPPCTTYLQQMRRTIEVVGVLREESIGPETRAALLLTFKDWKRSASTGL
jgi:anti-sigma factor RsiW